MNEVHLVKQSTFGDGGTIPGIPKVRFRLKASTSRDICGIYQNVRCYKSETPLPTGIRNRLAALQFDGTATTAQRNTRNVAGGQI
jgi:hypothetical protein